MDIREIVTDKKRFLDLLLLGDEQEDMIDRYLDRGQLFALYDEGTLRGICVLTREGPEVFEIKNLSVYEQYQRMGYGRALIEYAAGRCRGEGKTLLVGTGDSPGTLLFYRRCGFVFSHVVENFFTDNYDHPIWDGGALLRDMIYLKREL